MAGLDIDTALDWRGRAVVDRDGQKIGKFEELYLDEGDRPAWAAVNTGLFGLRQSFVPLDGARLDGDDLRVPYARDQVKDAPNIDPDEQLSSEEEELLERHYGGGGEELDDETRAAASSDDDAPRAAASSDDDAPGAAASSDDDAPRAAASPGDDDRGDSGTDDAMTRSEEELHVGTRTRERGRARLKKYVVTEHVTKTVPVQREEVRLEYEPNTDDRGDEQRDA